jgi:formylmethanofuran dehydrogenase subunit E
MKRSLMILAPCVLLAIVVTLFASQTPVAKLGFPTPQHNPMAGDPDWLPMAVQFHGHLGPGLVFGCFVGMVALDALDARGFFDVEVTTHGPLSRPPESCILDGLQLSTGATLGKHNIHIVEAEEYVFVVKNRRNGATVAIRPTQAALNLLPPMLGGGCVAQDQTLSPMSRAELAARRMLTMSQDELMTVEMNPQADTTIPQNDQ